MGAVSVCLLVAFLVGWSHAFYSPSDGVVELTPANFDSMVVKSSEVWVVEFYAPWCGHCQSFAPEYKKLAAALKGIVKVGAVDASEHQSIGGRYGVQGFPTVKIFGADKQKPSDYQGERSAKAIATNALGVVREVVSGRLGGKTGGGGRGGGGGGGSDKDVVELTDSNFEKTVLQSEDMWLVEFFAPWCGHCKNLAPHWASAATQLKGKVRLGAVDATVHTSIASRYQIQGFPTIKFFSAGKKEWDSAEDYNGGRTASDIVSWANDKFSSNLPPPEVFQLISQQVMDTCLERQICIISFLPHILDSGAKGRNRYLTDLLQVGEQYKQRSFGWVWIEGGVNMDLEGSVEVGGFGYPALVAVNGRKGVYSTLRGAFSKTGIKEFIRDLVGMRSRTVSLRGGKLPSIATTDPWDGEDGKLPDLDDDLDVSDVELDDLDTSKDEL